MLKFATILFIIVIMLTTISQNRINNINKSNMSWRLTSLAFIGWMAVHRKPFIVVVHPHYRRLTFLWDIDLNRHQRSYKVTSLTILEICTKHSLSFDRGRLQPRGWKKLHILSSTRLTRTHLCVNLDLHEQYVYIYNYSHVIHTRSLNVRKKKSTFLLKLFFL